MRGELTVDKETQVIQSVIAKGLEREELRDEILVQCVRQASPRPTCRQNSKPLFYVGVKNSVHFTCGLYLNQFYISDNGMSRGRVGRARVADPLPVRRGVAAEPRAAEVLLRVAAEPRAADACAAGGALRAVVLGQLQGGCAEAAAAQYGRDRGALLH